MKLYLLEPEVAGGIGSNSIIIYENQKMKEVKHLHYEFEGWLGDDLLTSSPCFIVTQALANDLLKSDLSGCKFEEVEISTSETFRELYPNRELPKFKRIIPEGVVEVEKDKVIKWSGNDFCLRNAIDLFLTQKALTVLESYNLNNCDITEFNY